LANAPITEAVIDFRARTPTTLRVDELKILATGVVGEYNAPEDIRVTEFGFVKRQGMPMEHNKIDKGLMGYRSKSKDEKRYIQWRKDGFTFSRLSPYRGWEDAFTEASKFYREYVKVAKIEEVSRIAVRFINRLALPLADVGDFSPYLAAPPPFPKEIPALIANFLTQLQVREPDTSIQAVVNQTIHQGGTVIAGSVPVILDFDVSEVASLPIDPDQLLPRFAALRNFKNRLFFASITERAAKLFE